jgi:hypothetical protein
LNANVVVRGLLDAGMIKQSFFTPGTTDSSFRIACDYPSNYSTGVYTGKRANLSPVRSIKDNTSLQLRYYDTPTQYSPDILRFYSPTYSNASVQYGRLGSNLELIHLYVNVPLRAITRLDEFNQAPELYITITVQHRYDSGTWKDSFSTATRMKFYYQSASATGQTLRQVSFTQAFITKGSNFSTLDFRYKFSIPQIAGEVTGHIDNHSLTGVAPNFGVASLTVTPLTPTGQDVYTLPEFPRFTS